MRVQCDHICRYMIKVETPKDNVLTIEPGFSEQSAIKGKELREHLIVNREFDGSQIDKAYTIKLQLINGEANL